MKKEKIIQFGSGGFLRGFFDWMLQILHETTEFDGHAVVVQSTPNGASDTLIANGCVYTHVCQGVEGIDVRKIEVISRCIKAYENVDAYLALADQPDFRFVVSNTTEAGICFDAGDRFEDRPAKSFPGKLTQLLKRRFDKKLPGFVFLPCELIHENGEALKTCILRYAALWGLGDDFADWIEKENIFCNTLVDRINVGRPPEGFPLEPGMESVINISEHYHLWVIEGYPDLFRELPLNCGSLNVILTDNILPYHERKVRILNGAHTALTPFALLSGFDTVKSCLDDEDMEAYLRKCVYEEIIPTLNMPQEDLVAYADAIMKRFANPYLKHYLRDISLNSINKFKVRVLPSILGYERLYHKLPPTLLFAFGKLIRFYRTEPSVRDDPDVVAFMKTATLSEILKNDSLWGQDLSDLEHEIQPYANTSP